MTKATRMRRALCLLLVLLAVFAVLPQPVRAADKTVQYADAEFISAYAADAVTTSHTYNVMHGSVIDGEYLFRPLDYVTRQEMFRVVYALSNAGKTDRNEMLEWIADMSSFSDKADIAPWAKSYAGYCISMGLFIGDGSNRLNPLNDITYFECAIVFLRVLGYTQNTLAMRADETQPQWRSRVIAEANRLGLFDNVLYYENGRYDQAIFRQDVAVMVANALQCKVVTHYLVLDEVIYVESDKTLAAHIFGKLDDAHALIVGMESGKYRLDNGIEISAADFKAPVEAMLGRGILYKSSPANSCLSWDGTLADETVALVQAKDMHCSLKKRQVEVKIGGTKYTYTVTADDKVCVFDGSNTGAMIALADVPAMLERWKASDIQVVVRTVVTKDGKLQSIRAIYLAQ